MIEDKKLSNNFRLYEFLDSQEARRVPAIYEKQFNPNEEILDNIQWLVTNQLQPIRSFLNCPITVSSGYRCYDLNKVIGGSETSQHIKAEAADYNVSSTFLMQKERKYIDCLLREKNITVNEKANANLYAFCLTCLWLDGLDVDQVISEYGDGYSPAWVHTSSSMSKNKREILRKSSNDPFTVLTLDQALSLAA